MGVESLSCVMPPSARSGSGIPCVDNVLGNRIYAEEVFALLRSSSAASKAHQKFETYQIIAEEAQMILLTFLFSSSSAASLFSPGSTGYTKRKGGLLSTLH